MTDVRITDAVFGGYDPKGNETWTIPAGPPAGPPAGSYVLNHIPVDPSIFSFTHNGKSFSLRLKDGVLVTEGDMPMSDAAKAFIDFVLRFAPESALERLAEMRNQGGEGGVR